MPSLSAALLMPDASLDFVFIDADHSYHGCSIDIEAWRHKVKPGGILSGHDYDDPENPQFGVKRAVDEAVKKHGWELELGKNCTWFVRL
jgi:predicted O-methyltransferase YrrM